MEPLLGQKTVFFLAHLLKERNGPLKAFIQPSPEIAMLFSSLRLIEITRIIMYPCRQLATIKTILEMLRIAVWWQAAGDNWKFSGYYNTGDVAAVV